MKRHDKSPKPTDIEIGARMRSFRIGLGMSQERVGGILGLTFQQIQKYEKGTNRISGSRMLQICDLLGVSPNELTGYNKTNPAPPQLSQGSIKFAHKYERLDPSQKRAVSWLFAAFLGEECD
jgi:transcriptional regulator with XRE-family HTH domain